MSITKFRNVREMFEKVKAQHAEGSKNSNKEFSILDSKIWKPTMDKKKDKTEYKIRFLPNPHSETGIPWILRKLHGFGPQGSTFYEYCPKSIGMPCPVCEQVNPLFKSENPMDNAVALKRYGKKRFVANILVIEDEREDGALNGKVFMMEFGVKIKEKLDKAMDLDFIYYSPDEGATFNLEVKTVSKYPNYDGSEFSRKSTKLCDGDEEKINEIAGQCYDLEKECLAPEKFHTYEQISQRYIAWCSGDPMPKYNNTTKTDEKKETVKEDDTDLIGQIEEAKKAKEESDDIFSENSESEDVSPPKEKEKKEPEKDDDDDIDVDELEKALDEEFGE